MSTNSDANLAITGGTGFISRGMLESCAEAGLSCRALSRSARPSWAEEATQWVSVPAYDDAATLKEALAGARYVLHLADNPARGDARSVEQAVRNCDALIAAIRSNRIAGVIVASSVYARNDTDSSTSSYGMVKRAIERQFLSATDIRTVVLRLPPVYGPEGRGGLATLAKLVHKGVPLPLGAASAPRAYLSRRNLASLVLAMVNGDNNRWKGAAGRIFEPSDGAAIATRDLIRAMAAQMDISARLVPVPVAVLRIAAGLTGKKELVSGAIDRLDVAPVGELETAFGWRPVERMPESLGFLRDEVRRS